MMTKYDYRRMGFNDTGKAPLLRTRIVSLVAKVLGLQIKIGAACYGASYETAINTRDQARLPAKRDAMQAASSQ